MIEELLVIEELLGQIKGVKNWRETTATVASVSRSERSRRAPAEAMLSFCYTPEGAEIQSGEFRVDEWCSLFNLEESETFPILYNPSHPEPYFSTEWNIRSRLKFVSLRLGGFAIVALFVIIEATIDK